MSQVALAMALSLVVPALGPAPAPQAAAAAAPTAFKTLEAWLQVFRPGAPWPAPEGVALEGQKVESVEGMVRLSGTVEGFKVLALTTDRKTVTSCSLEKANAFGVGDAATAEAYVARVERLMTDLCQALGQTLEPGSEAGNTTVHAGGYKAVYFGARVFRFRGGGFRGDGRVDMGSRRYYYRNVEGDTPGSVTLNLSRA